MTIDLEPSHFILRGLLRRLPAELHEALDYQFFNLPARYFRALDMKAVQTDLHLMRRIREEHVIAAVSELQAGLTIQVIVEKDEPRIFLRVVAILVSSGINILKAAIYTGKNDAMVVDHFVVHPRSSPAVLERTCLEIKDALIFGQLCQPKLPYPDSTGLLVTYSQPSPDQTTMTISARDQIGFLFRIARVFDALGVSLNYADIKTRDDHIIDTFHIVRPNGQLLHPAHLAELREAIYKAFAGG